MKTIFVAVLMVISPVLTKAELSPEAAAKNLPVEPFRIVGNIYYVGASDVASYLIESPDGLVLVGGGFAETAAQIERNIQTLGFRLSDVKIVLAGHAHPDHAGGLAALKRDTGATFAAMTEEVIPYENSGRGTFYRGERALFESVKVDRTLHDGSVIKLGNVVLTAHRTAGHTPGCTSWTLAALDNKLRRNVVIACQLTVPGGQSLVNNLDYPNSAENFRQSFARLRALPCDVPLAEHGSAFHLQEKLHYRAEHPSTNPFIDRVGCRLAIETAERDFYDALAAQSKLDTAAAH